MVGRASTVGWLRAVLTGKTSRGAELRSGRLRAEQGGRELGTRLRLQALTGTEIPTELGQNGWPGAWHFGEDFTG